MANGQDITQSSAPPLDYVILSLLVLGTRVYRLPSPWLIRTPIADGSIIMNCTA